MVFTLTTVHAAHPDPHQLICTLYCVGRRFKRSPSILSMALSCHDVVKRLIKIVVSKH